MWNSASKEVANTSGCAKPDAAPSIPVPSLGAWAKPLSIVPNVPIDPSSEIGRDQALDNKTTRDTSDVEMRFEDMFQHSCDDDHYEGSCSSVADGEMPSSLASLQHVDQRGFMHSQQSLDSPADVLGTLPRRGSFGHSKSKRFHTTLETTDESGTDWEGDDAAGSAPAALGGVQWVWVAPEHEEEELQFAQDEVTASQTRINTGVETNRRYSEDATENKKDVCEIRQTRTSCDSEGFQSQNYEQETTDRAEWDITCSDFGPSSPVGTSAEHAASPRENAHISKPRLKTDLSSFELLHCVGQGGFGKVYQVRHRRTGKMFALKSMRKDVVLEFNIEGTRTERSIMEQLNGHPFICSLHYAFQTEGHLYLCMDYINGGQLLQHIDERAPFSESEARFYLAEIILAVEELHNNGIIHRDLKPENVLMDREGHLIVTDFGCSHLSPDGSQQTCKGLVGTDMYMSPEQVNKKAYSRPVDWWAIGVLAWEMLTGTNPFEAKTKEATIRKIKTFKLQMPRHLSASTHSLLKGLLNKNPEKRLGTAGGAEEIKNHKFFAGLKWADVKDKMIDVPFIPPVADDLDTSYVRPKYLQQPAADSPVDTSPFLEKYNSETFAGFSYQRSPMLSSILASHALGAEITSHLSSGHPSERTESYSVAGEGDDEQEQDTSAAHNGNSGLDPRSDWRLDVSDEDEDASLELQFELEEQLLNKTISGKLTNKSARVKGGRSNMISFTKNKAAASGLPTDMNIARSLDQSILFPEPAITHASASRPLGSSPDQALGDRLADSLQPLSDAISKRAASAKKRQARAQTTSMPAET